jgi:hypothetical protein
VRTRITIISWMTPSDKQLTDNLPNFAQKSERISKLKKQYNSLPALRIVCLWRQKKIRGIGLQKQEGAIQCD